mmetsp:Transcript_95816/g.166473  ORF Transcript_95816/g.166473 Transcript_95816/m.166473 type:complete len:84 (-) Transcript_95816:146-397(-)
MTQPNEQIQQTNANAKLASIAAAAAAKELKAMSAIEEITKLAVADAPARYAMFVIINELGTMSASFRNDTPTSIGQPVIDTIR